MKHRLNRRAWLAAVREAAARTEGDEYWTNKVQQAVEAVEAGDQLESWEAPFAAVRSSSPKRPFVYVTCVGRATASSLGTKTECNCSCPAGLRGMKCYHITLARVLELYEERLPRRDERGRFVCIS